MNRRQFLVLATSITVADCTGTRRGGESHRFRFGGLAGIDRDGFEDVENAGIAYEHVIETSGTYEYVCEPQ